MTRIINSSFNELTEKLVGRYLYLDTDILIEATRDSALINDLIEITKGSYWVIDDLVRLELLKGVKNLKHKKAIDKVLNHKKFNSIDNSYDKFNKTYRNAKKPHSCLSKYSK